MAREVEIINGVSLITTGDMVVRARRTRGAFEPDSLAIWNEIARNGGRMLDIGAYTGIYAISAAMRGATPVAFEPNPNAAKRLYENANLNKVSFDVHNMAAWKENTQLHLVCKNGVALTSASTLIPHERGRRYLVKAVTIDSFMFKGVRAIKIDTERTEVEVLYGALQTIDYNRPTLLIENLDKDTNERIMEVIGRFGYKPERLSQAMSVWRTKNA